MELAGFLGTDYVRDTHSLWFGNQSSSTIWGTGFIESSSCSAWFSNSCWASSQDLFVRPRRPLGHHCSLLWKFTNQSIACWGKRQIRPYLFTHVGNSIVWAYRLSWLEDRPMGRLSFVAHSLMAFHPISNLLSWHAHWQSQHGLLEVPISFSS